MTKKANFSVFWHSLSGKEREKFRRKLGRELANKKIQKRLQADGFMKMSEQVFGTEVSERNEGMIREIFML